MTNTSSKYRKYHTAVDVETTVVVVVYVVSVSTVVVSVCFAVYVVVM